MIRRQEHKFYLKNKSKLLSTLWDGGTVFSGSSIPCSIFISSENGEKELPDKNDIFFLQK